MTPEGDEPDMELHPVHDYDPEVLPRRTTGVSADDATENAAGAGLSPLERAWIQHAPEEPKIQDKP